MMPRSMFTLYYYALLLRLVAQSVVVVEGFNNHQQRYHYHNHYNQHHHLYLCSSLSSRSSLSSSNLYRTPGIIRQQRQSQQQQRRISSSSLFVLDNDNKNDHTGGTNNDSGNNDEDRMENENDTNFFEDPSNMMQQHNLFRSNDNTNTNNNNNITTLVDVAVASAIVTENTLLRTAIRQLEEENQRLKVSMEQQDAQKVPQRETAAATVVAVSATEIEATADGPSSPLPRRPSRIILETFEGERRIAEFNDEVDDDEECVLVYDEDTDTMADGCPIEPNIGFGEALRDRATWLVGLLILQSLSGIILSRNELLLANHPVIIYYLTMMVGAGGNAGNQASVRVIRGIALGTLTAETRGQFLLREVKMAASLCCILSVAGFIRTVCFQTAFPEAITVTMALSLIVFISICLGAVLPLLLEKLKIDPAHSSTTIQVIMDILGVFLAVVVSSAVLDGPFGAYLLPKLGYA